MAPTVSLKPIEAEINRAKKRLQKCNRTGPPSKKARMNRKIKRLDLLIREVKALCATKHYNLVFRPK